MLMQRSNESLNERSHHSNALCFVVIPDPVDYKQRTLIIIYRSDASSRWIAVSWIIWWWRLYKFSLHGRIHHIIIGHGTISYRCLVHIILGQSTVAFRYNYSIRFKFKFSRFRPTLFISGSKYTIEDDSGKMNTRSNQEDFFPFISGLRRKLITRCLDCQA